MTAWSTMRRCAGCCLIHDLHPVPLETRLREALDTVRPYMESHGGNVELLSLEDDVARLGLQGHCKTCPSSSVTLELAIRGAIEEACPDLMGIEVEGLEPALNSARSTSFRTALRCGWRSTRRRIFPKDR